MEDVSQEYAVMAKKRIDNRNQIIAQQILLSKLQKQNERLKEEKKTLDEKNITVVKENEKFTKDNAALSVDIMDLIKRIDVSTLLKEIDIEEIKLLARNNVEMQMAF